MSAAMPYLQSSRGYSTICRSRMPPCPDIRPHGCGTGLFPLICHMQRQPTRPLVHVMIIGRTPPSALLALLLFALPLLFALAKLEAEATSETNLKICHCLFFRNFAYCALVLDCHAFMAFSSFSISSTYGISFSLSTGRI